MENYLKELKIKLLKYRRICVDSDCWEWTKGTYTKGYGAINSKLIKKCLQVHRVSAAIWLEFDLFSDLQVLHKCDNRLCFNPNHLFIGTNEDNIKDKVIKKRQYRKIDEEDKKKIIEYWKNNIITQKELAYMFKVTQPLISMVLHHKV
jgi:hypothetical protein